MLCIIMPIFATSALLTVIVGIANMATTKATGLPKKQLSPSKKKASSPIKRELTTMTISTNKKMGKNSYVCKIMQFKNDFAAIWCIKQYHRKLHVKITDMLEFCKAGLFTVVNCHTMVEKTSWLLTLKMDIHASLSLLVQMKRPMNPELSASQK
jgi:hypothetical protein